ncbi:MAG: metal-dependent transcriptional regulator, partial [Acidimicrobiales bacterium]
EAGRWEHVISDEVADRLMVVLGNPTTCPHGNPIPGSCAQAGPTSLLSDAEVGQQVCFARIMELAKFDDNALRYLEDHGFIPGTEATVSARGPDGSLVLDVGGETVVLGASMARLLCVGPGA